MKPRERYSLWALGVALAIYFLWQWQSDRYARPSNVRQVVLDMRSPDDLRRTEAKNVLLEMGTNAVPGLWQLYTTTNDTRRLAWPYRWLSGGPSRRHNPEFRERRIGYEGLAALGPLAEPASSNLVQEVVREPKSAGSATTLLMNIGPQALPAITPALTTTSAPAKVMLLHVIGHYRSAATPATVDVIAAIHGPDASVRRAAAATLAQIRGMPSLSVPALVTMLGDTNSEDRQMALHALSAFGTTANAASDELRRLAATAPLDDPERVAVAGVLIAMRDAAQARVEVLKLLASANPTNRLWALANLTEVPIPFHEIGPLAVRCLADPDPAIQLHAALELGQAARETGYPEALYTAGLGAGTPDLRLAFLKSAYRPDVSMLPMTIRALADADARVCRAAAISLTGQNFSTKPAQPALAALLAHADSAVRRDAYHALHNSDHRLFPMLVPWPANNPTESAINGLVRLHLLGRETVADTNILVTGVGILPQQFAPLARAATATADLNFIPSLKTMLTRAQDVAPRDAADMLVELSATHDQARAAVLELLLAKETPKASADGLRRALDIGRTFTLPIWLELAERAEPDLRREALLRISVLPGAGVERIIPILLKAEQHPELRVRQLATGLLRRYPAEVLDRHRSASPSPPPPPR